MTVLENDVEATWVVVVCRAALIRTACLLSVSLLLLHLSAS